MMRGKLTLTVAAAICAATLVLNPLSAIAQDSFQATDKNADGSIDRGEYRARMVETFYLHDDDRNGAIAKKDVKGATPAEFAQADGNGDGSLDMNEFLAIRMNGFNVADKNGDGAVDRAEVRAVGGLD